MFLSVYLPQGSSDMKRFWNRPFTDWLKRNDNLFRTNFVQWKSELFQDQWLEELWFHLCRVFYVNTLDGMQYTTSTVSRTFWNWIKYNVVKSNKRLTHCSDIAVFKCRQWDWSGVIWYKNVLLLARLESALWLKEGLHSIRRTCFATFMIRLRSLVKLCLCGRLSRGHHNDGHSNYLNDIDNTRITVNYRVCSPPVNCIILIHSPDFSTNKIDLLF